MQLFDSQQDHRSIAHVTIILVFHYVTTVNQLSALQITFVYLMQMFKFDLFILCWCCH